MSSPDPATRSRRDFIAALQSRGVSADESRVSRWESGTYRMAPEVLDAYEHLLGLPTRSVAALEQAQRALADDLHPSVALSSEDPDVRHETIDRLITTAVGGAADGGEWHRLAESLAHFEHIYLPGATWREISLRLLSEEARSLGWARIRRASATRILVRHPAASTHIIRGLGATVVNTSAQSVQPPPLTHLCDVPDARAADIVLKVLEGPPSSLHEGAAWTTAVKLHRKQFTGDELARVLEITGSLLSGPGYPQLFPGALDMATQLPTEEFSQLLDQIADREARHHLLHARETYELVSDEVARDWSRRLADHAIKGLWGPGSPMHDPMLEQLIREALFQVHRERRSQSASLLSVSPYRPALAAATLVAVRSRPGQETAARLLQMLCQLTGPALAPELLEHSHDAEHPAVRALSLTALAMTPVDLDPETDRELVRRMHQSQNQPVRHATMLALGMHGSQLLGELAGHHDEWISGTAQSWLDRGPRVFEPTGG